MQSYSNNLLKQIPALRLLLPIVIGILLQYHLNTPIGFIITIAATCLTLLIAFSFISLSKKFEYSWAKGLLINIIILCVGGGLSFTKNISNQPAFVGKYFSKDAPLVVTLQENLSVKEKSYKALASVNAIDNKGAWKNVDGDVLLYFRKDSSMPDLHYGSQIIIHNNIANIVNSGNPGGFDYARYCSFQGIYYQAFLGDNDYTILTTTQTNWFAQALIDIRTSVINTLKTNIKNPNELSVAEALLIGYRDELDRDLVRAYSNTGVVHIIAISGLHLGMIYGLLLFLLKPFKRFKAHKILQPIIIIFVLWMFSFIAGLAPSILRSAIMFTCIVMGESLGKRSNIYNGLAISALIILFINPFSLWDVGFQLSYSAVLSIVVFSPYVKKWCYFENKLLKGFWELNSITISAQVLTLPIVLYHFHQFPNLVLFTNIFAVPFSGLILYLELLLIVFSWFKPLVTLIGKATEWCIAVLNKFIINIDSLPFSVWESIQISIPQAIILFAAIIGFCYWLIERKSKYFLVGLSFFTVFIAIRSIDFIQRTQQQKIIVYNVPKHTAIDLVDGRKYQFIGDSILTENGFLRNFHIKPSRILHRINPATSLKNILYQDNFIITKNKTIAIVDAPIKRGNRLKVDAVVVTKNPKVYMNQLTAKFDCNQYIFDGSNSMWKINKWKQYCDSLHLQYHISSLQGAYEINL
ncbi:MAG: ComEC/Rec2 family competence protein [Chitinophagaceae bacterium]